jgi:PTH1 family peptidyl-tRNA hydrolase
MRVRLGIGKPSDKSRIEDYVLQKFDSGETDLLQQIIQLAADAATEIVLSDMQTAMVKYHTKNISNL